VLVGEDLHRGAQEAQHDPVAPARRRALGVSAQQIDVAPRRGVGGIGPKPRGALVVERHLGGVDDDVGARELAELAQLGLVNAACAGPRRPSTTTSSTDAARSASSAWSAVSVVASSSRSSTSIRATSIATLPLPTTTARRADRSKLWSAKCGWPLYQATNSVAACEPDRSSPGIPSLLSLGVPTA
jgi:hypothetical protein